MNGRVYDPALGQFVQPDNYVQFPEYAQSYNRFSYVLNNPLKYTDPSGEFLAEAATVIQYAMYAYSAISAANNISTESYQGGFQGGVTALFSSIASFAVSQGIGSIFNYIGSSYIGNYAESLNGIIWRVGTSPIQGYLTSQIMSGGNSKYTFGDAITSIGLAGAGEFANYLNTTAITNEVAKNDFQNSANERVELTEEQIKEYRIRARDYNGSIDESIHSDWAKDLVKQHHNVTNGQYSINDITTKVPKGYGLNRANKFIDLETGEVNLALFRPETKVMHLSKHLLTNYSTTGGSGGHFFHAVSGHELIHAYHYHKFGIAIDRKFTETTAYRYQYNYLNSNGFGNLAKATMLTAQELGYWNTKGIPKSYLNHPFK